MKSRRPAPGRSPVAWSSAQAWLARAPFGAAAGAVGASLATPWAATATASYRPGWDAIGRGRAGWLVTLGVVVLGLVPTRLRVVADGLAVVMGSVLAVVAAGCLMKPATIGAPVSRGAGLVAGPGLMVLLAGAMTLIASPLMSRRLCRR